MNLEFLCIQGGKRYYAVRRQGQQLFAGTQAECRRFLEIHEQKVLEERRGLMKTPRSRPYLVRTYHLARTGA